MSNEHGETEHDTGVEPAHDADGGHGDDEGHKEVAFKDEWGKWRGGGIFNLEAGIKIENIMGYEHKTVLGVSTEILIGGEAKVVVGAESKTLFGFENSNHFGGSAIFHNGHQLLTPAETQESLEHTATNLNSSIDALAATQSSIKSTTDYVEANYQAAQATELIAEKTLTIAMQKELVDTKMMTFIDETRQGASSNVDIPVEDITNAVSTELIALRNMNSELLELKGALASFNSGITKFGAAMTVLGA